MQTVMVDIEKLIPDPNNERKHDQKNIDAIVGSLTKFNQVEPLICRRNNVLIGGHGRLEAMKKIGMKQVAVHYVDLKTETEAAALRVALNRTAELGTWDDELLGKTLQALREDDFGIEDIGFDPGDYWDEEKTEGLTDPDEVPEVPQNARNVKRGDIWQLGDHRMMCGDSTSREDVERLMGGEKADICFTSPPYNVGKTTRGNLYQNDDDNKSDYVGFLDAFTNIALNVCSFVFVNIQALSNNWIDVFQWQHNFLGQLKDVFIWNKKQCPPNIQKGSFNTKFEFIYAFATSSNGRNFPCSWQGKYPNVVETESNAGNDFAETHKAGFPVAFPMWFLEKLDFVKSVYEPFCGTGTTLIACEKTGRKCYGMEIDPHYCSVILERWEKFSGKKAELCK